MNVLDMQEGVKRLLRAEFRRERASGFELLRQIPSTQVRKFLDYFATLDRAEGDALAEAMGQIAFLSFFPYDGVNPYQAGNAAYRRCVDSLGRMWGWRYEAVQDAARVDIATLEKQPNPFFPLTSESRSWLQNLRPSKAAEIRRVVKLGLSQIIVPLDVSHQGGLWCYQGDLQGRPIRINMDYHQKYAQFDYGIDHPYQAQEVGKLRLDMSYEQLLGLSSRWDCVEEGNLDQSIALLKDLVLRCAQFRNTLPA
jgi:hypothetical protein